ncbi:hypothetical protein MTO96_033338 [Rhipicephalus appendiculatus]
MAPKFYCVMRNCTTKEGDKVVYHHFPSNDDQRQLWTEFVQAVEGASWRPEKRSQVCSQHFSSDCYMYNMQYCADFGLETRRNYLKKGSVPTLYPPERHGFGDHASRLLDPWTLCSQVWRTKLRLTAS